MKSIALKNTSLVAALLAAGVIGGAGITALDGLHSRASAAVPPAISATVTPGAPIAPMALPDFPQITAHTARPWSTSASPA